MWVKEATVGTYPVGPFVNGSGVRLGSLNIVQGEMQLSKNGGAFGTISGCATAYPAGNGYYWVGMDTTDKDTRGPLRLEINNSGALPVWADFHVVPTQKYDFFFGDGVVPSVSHVGIVGTSAYAALVGTVNHVLSVGTVAHVASLSNPVVPFVGSVGYAGVVGSVGHVASMSNPAVPFVGSVGYTGIVGSVGHVASMSNPSVPFVGSTGLAAIVGTVAYTQIVGTVTYAALVGTVSHSVSVATLAGLAAAACNDIADATLKRDIDQVEASAAIHSLCTALLKAVSKIADNAGTLEIYRTDGVTLHASQTISTDASAEPIDGLSGAS